MNRSSSLFYHSTKQQKKPAIKKEKMNTTFCTKFHSLGETTRSSSFNQTQRQREKSFFKIAETKVKEQKTSNLKLNALNDFMKKNEFYFDLNQWKNTRTNKIHSQITAPYLDRSVIIPRKKFNESFSNTEIIDKFQFNLNFFDNLSCFNSILKLTKNDLRLKKSEKNVPE